MEEKNFEDIYSTGWDMENQRRTPRLACAVPVDSGAENVFAGTQTVDVCRGGIGFISDHEIPLEREIMVELDLDKNGEPVFAVGRVKWVKQISENGQYRVGMSFVDIIKGSKSRLQKYFRR